MEPGSYVDDKDWPIVEVDRHGKIPVHPHVAKLIEKNKAEACPQRTDGWYKKRQCHLTASSIASAVGENPYEKRMTALRKKLGFGPPFKGNAATAHGNYYEDIAVKIYEERTGEKQIEFGLLESIKKEHDGEPVDTSFLAGSPDGITASGRLLECKCPYRRKPNGEVPHLYTFQIQSLMHMLDLKICDFFEYVPGCTWQDEIFEITTVVRSDVWFNTVFPQMRRFWDEVEYFRREVAHNNEDVIKQLTEEPKTRRNVKKEITLDITPVPAPKHCTGPMTLDTMLKEKEEGVFLPWGDMGHIYNNMMEAKENGEKLRQDEEDLVGTNCQIDF